MAPHNYALNIRLECIRNSEWVAKLERRFPLTDSMLLNGDDLNHLLSESVQEVVKENIRQSQALSPGSRSAIRAALEKMFEVQQVSTLSSGWDSVYWHIEDQRPDRISEAINHTYAQLDETSQHQVLHALNCFPENSQKDVDMGKVLFF